MQIDIYKIIKSFELLHRFLNILQWNWFYVIICQFAQDHLHIPLSYRGLLWFDAKIPIYWPKFCISLYEQSLPFEIYFVKFICYVILCSTIWFHENINVKMYFGIKSWFHGIFGKANAILWFFSWIHNILLTKAWKNKARYEGTINLTKFLCTIM